MAQINLTLITGSHAHRLRNYEPGTPMGLAEMQVFAYKPFLNIMESIVQENPYFMRANPDAFWSDWPTMQRQGGLMVYRIKKCLQSRLLRDREFFVVTGGRSTRQKCLR